MNRQTWILVANAAKARLFSSDGRDLTEVLDAIHPASAARSGDLQTDTAGRRGQGPLGRGDRPCLGSGEPPRKEEAKRFARYLAALLKTGLDNHAYDGLVLVAPPPFLGLLKQHIDVAVASLVKATLGRNLVLLEPLEIQSRLHALE